MKKILVFDDNEEIIELCKIILENAGYAYHYALTARNLEERVLELMPHLILMDNWLPYGGGLDATQRLKNHAQLRHIPVIYFTANTEASRLAKEAGADGYITKPFDVDYFEKYIERFLKA